MNLFITIKVSAILRDIMQRLSYANISEATDLVRN